MDPITGLSRYRPDGLGIPPETEASHFTHILQPYADKHGLSVLEFADAYDAQELLEPELDEYFMHDRAVRESGHDTTYRFEKRCANLATIDLNALLYKFVYRSRPLPLFHLTQLLTPSPLTQIRDRHRYRHPRRFRWLPRPRRHLPPRPLPYLP
jgi:hypothetical protein